MAMEAVVISAFLVTILAYVALLGLVRQFVALVLAVLCPFACFVLWPVSKAAKGTTPINKVYVSDFFSLSILVAIPLAILAHHRIAPENQAMSDLSSIGFFLVAVNMGLWWQGARSLSGLGVRHAGRRIAFLAFVLPLAIGGSLVSYGVLLTIPALSEMSTNGVQIWVASAMLCILAGWCGRRTAKWIVKDQQPFGPPAAVAPTRRWPLPLYTCATIGVTLFVAFNNTWRIVPPEASSAPAYPAPIGYFPDPTISATLPPLMPATPTTSQAGDLVLHELAWLQLEFVPVADAPYLDRTLAEVREYQKLHGPEQGYIRTYHRPESPTGLATLLLPWSDLAALLPEPPCDLYLCQESSGPYSRVTDGFCFRIDHRVFLYGTQSNGLVTSLGVAWQSDERDTRPLDTVRGVLNSLSPLLQAHLVDWCQAQVIPLDSPESLRAWLARTRSHSP